MSSADVVNAYFRAMQRGQEAASELLALFAEDAVYIEPFAGEVRTHEGRKAIEACFDASWEQTPPDLHLSVDRIDVDGERVRSEWTCSSPAFEAPVRGIDLCEIRAGKISRLEVRFR